ASDSIADEAVNKKPINLANAIDKLPMKAVKIALLVWVSFMFNPNSYLGTYAIFLHLDGLI
ncbi:MAG: hypothetical protein K2Y14_10420, partial [Burkholderiales bacterium]|nr:hypothetical protein [Burkholderiales bacterium]